MRVGLPAEDMQPALWSAKQPSCISQCGMWLTVVPMAGARGPAGGGRAAGAVERGGSPTCMCWCSRCWGSDDAHIESESCQARCCCATKHMTNRPHGAVRCTVSHISRCEEQCLAQRFLTQAHGIVQGQYCLSIAAVAAQAWQIRSA